jgi:antitoxin (DNA-binding transcriptional repressor) of toxin-antitoxin stability system
MKRYTLKEAQDNLSKLLEEAHSGIAVVILDEAGQQVQLVPLQATTKPRQVGSARGQIEMSPDFDEPLSDFDGYGIDHR